MKYPGKKRQPAVLGVVLLMAGGGALQAALICDLDATVAASVLTNASGVAINWLDQSGNGNDAGDEARIGNPTFPSASLSASGLPGVDMLSTRNGYRLFNVTEQDRFLDFTGDAATNSGFAVFIAFKLDGLLAGNRQPVFANHGNAATASSFGLRYENGTLSAFLGGTVYAKTVAGGNLPVAAGDTVVLAFNYDKATGAIELWDSKNGSSLTAGGIPAADFSSTQPLYLGTSENNGQFMHGMIGEVRVYDEFLDATTFSNQAAAMSATWTVATGIQKPVGLTAVGIDSAVLLDWFDDGTGLLDEYTVYRSTISGTNTYVVLTNVTASAYTDAAVTNGTTYYYAVTATDTNGVESEFSDEVSATPAATSTNVVLFQHLDATLPASVTTNASGEVSAWADQSGNGNHASDGPGDPVLFPSSSLSATGLAGMDVRTNRAALQLIDAAATDAVLDFTGAAAGNSGFAVLVAFKADSVFEDNTRNSVIGNFANIATGFQMRYDRGVMQAYLGGAAITKPLLAEVEARDTLVFAFNYTASSGEMLFWDSKNDHTGTHTVIAADFSTPDPMRIAGTSNGGQYMDGMVGEVQIFAGALGPSDFVSIRQAMADRWVVVTDIQTPEGLSAMADDEWVDLDWLDDVSGDLFAGFTVYRSTESGTNYVEIASGLTESAYLDTGMPGGVSYYYVVTAVDTNGMESPYSNEIVAVPNPVVRLQHLDATVPGSVLTAGGVVTRWLDQAASGNDAVPAVGEVLYPSAGLSESGLAGVDMQSDRNSLQLFSAAGSDSWLNPSSGTNGFCVLLAVTCDALGTGDNHDVIGNSADGVSGFGMRYTGAGELQAWLGGRLIASAGPGVVADGDTLILGLNYDADAGAYDFWDSQNYTSATGGLARADFSTGEPVTLGSAASSSRYLNGMVGEVKVFGSRLSPANFERQRVALLNKWTDKPNIVLVLVDDWAWNASPIRMDDRMANSTMDLVEMPHFETLASQGMRFRNAYASAMCVPSRACLQTGQSSARHQFTVELEVTDYFDTRAQYAAFPVTPNGIRKPLPASITTIPEALRPLGYKCAHYGKWHLDSDPGAEGYQEHDGNTDNQPGTTLANVMVIPPDIANPKRMIGITDRTTAFMEKHVQAGNPFYVQLSHYAQHEPRECFPSSRARYQNHPHIVALNGGQTDPSAISARNDPAVWLGMAYDLDQTIGQVLQKIDTLGIADNTYVIVMSDNGYRHTFAQLPQPLHASKWWVWQGGIRVPMIVRGPGIDPGSVATANVVNYDLLPTYVEWGGGDPTRLQNIDGTSLAGLMAGEIPAESFLNRSLYFHYPHYRTTMPHSSIVKGNYKVVHFYETPVRFPAWDPVMLFDLASDPGEYHNITPDEPAVAQALYSDLTNHLAEAGARIPANNAANYSSAVYEAAIEYGVRVAHGPFIGSRSPAGDEAAQVQTFIDYWMDSWGVPLGGDTNDVDGDRLANLGEYALGGDPTDELDVGAVPTLTRTGGAFHYTHARRNDDSDLVYTVEASTNLVTGGWMDAGFAVNGTSVDGTTLDEVTHSVPTLDGETYIRLNVGRKVP